jgi:hypothetical protein
MTDDYETEEVCPICKEAKDEMGTCQHGNRMCADCWYWFNAPCCGGEDWDGNPQKKE